MGITKSEGQTTTEKLLAELCDKTFLKLWAYPNPYKSDGKELCDLLAIFENHVFIFFDRESKKFDNTEADMLTQWLRWEKEVIQKQKLTAEGAKRYILSSPEKIYLDQKNTVAFPISIPRENLIIHKIIVAHGAKDVCKQYSEENIYGSMSIIYGNKIPAEAMASFVIFLDNSDPIHILDSHNMEIILHELDTFYDFSSYLITKEEAVKKYDTLCYCGEEDLLAHYFANYDEANNKYSIGVNRKDINGVFIGEGEWQDFVNSTPYKRRKEANKVSQVWDDLLQKTCQNAFDGSLGGNGNVFNSQSSIYEMAKEPRFSRRAMSEAMINSIKNFPDEPFKIMRNISFMPSFYKDKGYVFLQLWHPNIVDYENDYRPKRQVMLEIACAAAKNKFPHLNKVMGIAIDAPKFSIRNSEDFILLNCEDWPEDIKKQYEEDNKRFNFFGSSTLTRKFKTTNDFPNTANPPKVKIGRNEKCPCGSEKKYKYCCDAPS